MAEHFAEQADAYAASRPDYPAALFDWLADRAPGRALAWDCGTGTGQAARPLAARFDLVVATDASAEQLARATAPPGVHLVRAAAEASPLRDGAASLVAVAQALHWFDVARFAAEARRVLRPGGVLAAWTYGDAELDDEAADAVLRAYDRGPAGAHWPPERAHVRDGYRRLAPVLLAGLVPLGAPAFAIERRWTADAVADYVGTWSATVRLARATGTDPVGPLRAALRRALGARATGVRWPVTVVAGRVQGG